MVENLKILLLIGNLNGSYPEIPGLSHKNEPENRKEAIKAPKKKNQFSRMPSAKMVASIV
jgi:hypothetical protein